MSKSVPRIVPWLNSEMWRETRRLLFSSEVDDIRMGLLQAKIWMDKGKVPTAVESTVNFLETVLMDTENLEEFLQSRRIESESEGEDDDCDALFSDAIEAGAQSDTLDTDAQESLPSSIFDNDRLLRLAYNTAIIRFVNELVDRAQKNLFATSITKLAEQINLPRVFVDIRHDGTHDKLNSLELLRWAAWEALKWLEDQYWSFEDDLNHVTWNKDFNANVHGLLDQYYDQLDKISEPQSVSSLEKSSNSRIISQIDFLQTLPRIMKTFLISLCDYKRSFSNLHVIESIIRLLARNNGDIFYSIIMDVLLERKEALIWIPWIIEELKKSDYVDMFLSDLFKKFGAKSSEKLFNEILKVIWELLNISDNEKYSKMYYAFECVYMKRISFGSSSSKTSLKDCMSLSRNLIRKRKYSEDEELDGWAVVNENWRPCPLGFAPN